MRWRNPAETLNTLRLDTFYVTISEEFSEYEVRRREVLARESQQSAAKDLRTVGEAIDRI